jgi:hypothetical protein
MSANQVPGREDKKKKKKARAALLAFLKRLRKACKVMDTAETWNDCVKELDALLQEYQLQIPGVNLQRLRSTMQLGEPNRAGIKKACKVLQFEVERAIDVLPAAGGLAAALVGGLIVVAIAIAAAVIYVERTAVEIVIVNNGCSPIRLAGGFPIDLPGLHLPHEAIPSGGRAIAQVPRITVDLDATGGDRVALKVLGITRPFDLGRRATQILWDGRPLLGQRTTLNLASLPQHELIVTCR